MNELDTAVNTIRDLIRPHELDIINDSSLVQTGLITLNFTLGKTGLRWLFTRHTYCFLDVARQVGTLASELKHRAGTTLVYSLDASIVATICLWLVRERAKEEDRYLKTTVGLRLVNEYLKVLKVPGDLQSLIRAEFRHHFQMYISDEGKYQCGLNYMKIKQLPTHTTNADKHALGGKRILPFPPKGE